MTIIKYSLTQNYLKTLCALYSNKLILLVNILLYLLKKNIIRYCNDISYIQCCLKVCEPLEFSIFLHKYDPKHHQISI